MISRDMLMISMVSDSCKRSCLKCCSFIDQLVKAIENITKNPKGFLCQCDCMEINCSSVQSQLFDHQDALEVFF